MVAQSKNGQMPKKKSSKQEEQPSPKRRSKLTRQHWRRLFSTMNQFSYDPFRSRLDRGGGTGSTKVKPNYDDECGYPTDEELDTEYYKNAYNRWGIATRAINLWADETWSIYPEITENSEAEKTVFEKAWLELVRKTVTYHYLHRVDRLSGIGEFGILFLGFDDGGKLNKPPKGIDRHTGKRIPKSKAKLGLNYLRAFDQTIVKVIKTDEDPRSPRNGQPVLYEIQFQSSGVTGEAPEGTPVDGDTQGTTVHWTRVLHVADNRQTSEVFGTPRLQSIINFIHDCRKITGGAGEMFWRGGFPGYSFEAYPDMVGESEVDIDSLKEEMLYYQLGMQRYLATDGGKWTSLQPQVADPDKHLQWNLAQICLSIGVPLRIFMGSESGHLASTTDNDAWRNRCSERQNNYLEPMVLRPFIDRLIDMGVLPEVENYYVKWKDLRILSDKDLVEVSLKKVQSLTQYVSGNVNYAFPLKLMLTMVMGFTDEEADAVLKELEKNPPEPMGPPVPEPVMAGGNQIGNPRKAPPGRQKGTPPEGKGKVTKLKEPLSRKKVAA